MTSDDKVLNELSQSMMAHHGIINTLRPRQNGRRLADDTLKCIFLNGNVRISIKISLKFVPKGPINNNPALVWIMAWCRPGDKPLSETMMVILPMHICVTRPQSQSMMAHNGSTEIRVLFICLSLQRVQTNHHDYSNDLLHSLCLGVGYKILTCGQMDNNMVNRHISQSCFQICKYCMYFPFIVSFL